jgi:hypothetical protein
MSDLFLVASLRSTPCGSSKQFKETLAVQDVPAVQPLRYVQDVDEDDSA